MAGLFKIDYTLVC